MGQLKYFLIQKLQALKTSFLKKMHIFIFLLIHSNFVMFPVLILTQIFILPKIHLLIGEGFYYFFISIYFIIDFITESLYLFTCIFLFSFVSSKREMLELESKEEKSLFMYYHLKKALMFTIINFFLRSILIITFLFKSIFFKFGNSIETTVYSIGRNLILILIFQYFQSLKISNIQENNKILKKQKENFIIENSIRRNFPSKKYIGLRISHYFNDSSINNEDIKNNIEEDIEEILNNAEFNLNDELEINERQEFKNIFKNKGKNSYFPLVIIICELIDCYLSVFGGLIFLLLPNMQSIFNL